MSRRSFVPTSLAPIAALALLIACKPEPVVTPPDGGDGQTTTGEPETDPDQAAKAREAAEKRAKLELLDPLPGVSAPAPVELPEALISTLDNGLELIVLVDHESPLVEISLRVRAGEIYDPADKLTVAGMTAALLTEGTTKHDKVALDQRIDRTGGSMSSGAQDELASLGATLLSEDLGTGLELIAEQVQFPAFPADSLTKLQDQQIQGVRAAKGNPQVLASTLAGRIIYGEVSPYGRMFPSDAQIKALTRDDVVAFHQRHYVPNNAMLIVSGDVDPKQVDKLVRKHFGKWAKGDAVATPLAKTTPPSEPIVHIIDRKASAQANIYVIAAGPKVGEPGWLELQVLDSVLSGGTMSTRLNFVLREQLGLTYGASSYYDYGFDGGMFVAGGGTKNKTADQFAGALVELVYGLGDARLADTELARVQGMVSGVFARTAEGVGAATELTALIRLYGLPADFWARYRSDVAAMSSDRLLAQAKQTFDRDHLQIVAVGKAKELGQQLAGFGKIRVYDTDLIPVEAQ
ncbi:M16 family metallopeptidase [Nannocystaceae bacterium ST9]